MAYYFIHKEGMSYTEFVRNAFLADTSWLEIEAFLFDKIGSNSLRTLQFMYASLVLETTKASPVTFNRT